ncbi:MAG: glycosyltransferase [Gemmatimonadota bacterium]|nr:glycosyltransferase [Gemmatimonadota bacterium]
MRAVFYWGRAGLGFENNNPYGPLLARAMGGIGVDLEAGYDEDLSESWLMENRDRVDVLHLNWPSYMYNTDDAGESVEKCAELIGHLTRARFLGYRIVWTVHNLYPHERPHPGLDRLARLAITRLATALIVHCEYGRAQVLNHFHRTHGIFTIPHGHFIDAYENKVSRIEARRQLGIAPDGFVYLFFGNVKRYKGVEKLLEVFSRLPGEHLRLLLAAKSNSEYSAEVIARAHAGDPRILTRTAEFFPDEELQLFFNAADVMVLPFVDMLTSGSAITAMSFARPVIAPGIGCLPELLDEYSGIVYDARDGEGLARAMDEIRERDMSACSESAFQRAKALSWEPIAEKTLEAYKYASKRSV